MGRIEPCGGDGPVCCFGMFRVRMGGQWLGVFYISPRDSHGQRLWLVARTLMPVRGGRYLCVVAVLRFPLLDRP